MCDESFVPQSNNPNGNATFGPPNKLKHVSNTEKPKTYVSMLHLFSHQNNIFISMRHKNNNTSSILPYGHASR